MLNTLPLLNDKIVNNFKKLLQLQNSEYTTQYLAKVCTWYSW